MTEQQIEKFMLCALEEANKALESDDVPIGAVLVKDQKIIAAACNQREKTKNTIAHAEILAIEQACQKLNRWILDDCELFVTLEPCVMCFGAIVGARIPTVYFGAHDPKTGACGSLTDLAKLKHSTINHHTKFVGGFLEEQCAEQIRRFFQEKREKKKAIKAMQKNEQVKFDEIK